MNFNPDDIEEPDVTRKATSDQIGMDEPAQAASDAPKDPKIAVLPTASSAFVLAGPVPSGGAA
jgi:hypothetical protein